MQEKKLKKKASSKKESEASGPELNLDIGTAFSVADAKENDFDLDLGMANWQGKKGQAGSRSKSVEGGEPYSYPIAD